MFINRPTYYCSARFYEITYFQISDIQFYQFMKHVTNLSKHQIFLVLDMLDHAATGYIEFKDFYLLMCIFIALKVRNRGGICYRVHSV